MKSTKPPPGPKMLGMPTLRARGWTAGLIEKFLPVPDATVANPYYRSGPPRKLYLESHVESVEASDAFRIALRPAKKRKAAAMKGTVTKLARIESYVDGLVVDVLQLSGDDLLRRACHHFNIRRADRRHLAGEDNRPATPKSDPRFLARIEVNYLRHVLSSYHDHLESTYGRVGAEWAYQVIKAKVLDAIAKAYPALASECDRQKAGL